MSAADNGSAAKSRFECSCEGWSLKCGDGASAAWQYASTQCALTTPFTKVMT
jgi:hypothetical protein